MSAAYSALQACHLETCTLTPSHFCMFCSKRRFPAQPAASGDRSPSRTAHLRGHTGRSCRVKHHASSRVQDTRKPQARTSTAFTVLQEPKPTQESTAEIARDDIATVAQANLRGVTVVPDGVLPALQNVTDRPAKWRRAVRSALTQSLLCLDGHAGQEKAEV